MNTELIKDVFTKDGHQIIFDSSNLQTENYFEPLFKDPHKNIDNDTIDSNDTRFMLGKELVNIWKLLHQIGATLKYVCSGSYGHVFKGEINRDGKVVYEFCLKVSAYVRHSHYGDVTNVSRPENAEIMMLRALSYFIAKKETMHLLVPIQTFYANIKNFLSLEQKGFISGKDCKLDQYHEFVQNYKKGIYEDVVSILISEWANHGDFLKYMKSHYLNFKLYHWKVFFFQLLSVLAVILHKYPNFRHNDMKANNVLIHKIPRKHETGYEKDIWKKGRTVLYKICSRTYLVPDIGYCLKLWDFDFACIPSKVDNLKVNLEWTKKINVTPEKNQYYDIHYFFNTLISKRFLPEIIRDPEHVPVEVKEFVIRVVPDEYRHGEKISKHGRLLVNEEYTTPQKLLETDPFFEEFRCFKNDLNIYNVK